NCIGMNRKEASMSSKGKAGSGENGDSRLHELVQQFASEEFGALESRAAIEEAVKQILLNVGEDPTRDGLRRTPQRVARMYEELLEGYHQDLQTILNDALFEVEYGEGEMVVVADIEFQSLCEHHMLPIVGKAHVAYLPESGRASCRERAGGRVGTDPLWKRRQGGGAKPKDGER